MDHHPQQSEEVIQGIAPHSCQFCTVIRFDPSQCLREGHCGQPFNFSRREVFNAASHGCRLFLWARDKAGRAEPWALQIRPSLLDEGVGTLRFDWVDENGENVIEDWSRHMFATEGNI